MMTGCIPADVPPLKHGDVGAEPCGLKRDGQTGKARANDTNVNIQVEGEARVVARCCGVSYPGRACGSLAHVVFLPS